MKPINIVLIEPEIPWNSGAIGRLAVNTNSKLHFIKPLGFDISDKAIKRAGLDYWQKLNPTVWESFDEFLDSVSDKSRLFFATTKTNNLYFEKSFKGGDYILFGSETRGISENILNKFSEQTITIPMGKEGRSLNLAMSVSIILYKALEQNIEILE
jgi:tRNA (cytidine/uridine-2'-O-)-methyltransferase